eukprot:4804805-Alexandrium_andersonii.AAC.1
MLLPSGGLPPPLALPDRRPSALAGSFRRRIRHLSGKRLKMHLSGASGVSVEVTSWAAQLKLRMSE